MMVVEKHCQDDRISTVMVTEKALYVVDRKTLSG